MPIHRLTDNEIKLRITAKYLQWPKKDTSVAWSRLHDAVEALHGLAHVADDHCHKAEQDADLSPEGIVRRRSEVGRQALVELSDFKPFKTAEKSVLNDIELLETKMTNLPKPPANASETLDAQEIRAYIRQQKSPIDFVLKHLSDPHTLGAVLTSRPYLSGLSDVEFKLVSERARAALHPVQANLQTNYTKAIAELREGVAATQRLLLERTEMRVDDDGQFRSIHEPPPRGKLTAPKTENTVTAASAP